jgi:hypothetical protein
MTDELKTICANFVEIIERGDGNFGMTYLLDNRNHFPEPLRTAIDCIDGYDLRIPSEHRRVQATLQVVYNRITRGDV